MKKILFICLILLTAFSLNAQRKAKTITIDIKPIQGEGFNGSLDLVYAFENCFGDINMLFTYKNVKINSFSYGGRTFTANDLGINSFEKYLIVPDIYLNSILEPAYFKDGRPRYGGIDGGIQKTIKSNIKLDNVLDKQLAGCYGQTLNLRSLKGVNYKYLYVSSSKKNYANFSWNASLSEIAKCKINPDCDEKKLNKETAKEQLEDLTIYKIRVLFEFDIFTHNYRYKDEEFASYTLFVATTKNPYSIRGSIIDYATNRINTFYSEHRKQQDLGQKSTARKLENVRKIRLSEDIKELSTFEYKDFQEKGYINYFGLFDKNGFNYPRDYKGDYSHLYYLKIDGGIMHLSDETNFGYGSIAESLPIKF